MTSVAQFHNLAHIFISFVGAILLLAIYSNIRKRFRQILEEDESQKRVDSGLLYQTGKALSIKRFKVLQCFIVRRI